jgi:hypothetical protein
MGRDKNEQSYPPKGRASKPLRGSNNLTSFRPSELDKQNLRTRPPALGEVLALLEKKAASGYKLSLGMNLDNGSFYAIFREGGSNWQTTRAVGVWSSSLEKALICIFYYLVSVNPDFPEGVLVEEEGPVDW